MGKKKHHGGNKSGSGKHASEDAHGAGTYQHPAFTLVVRDFPKAALIIIKLEESGLTCKPVPAWRGSDFVVFKSEGQGHWKQIWANFMNKSARATASSGSGVEMTCSVEVRVYEPDAYEGATTDESNVLCKRRIDFTVRASSYAQEKVWLRIARDDDSLEAALLQQRDWEIVARCSKEQIEQHAAEGGSPLSSARLSCEKAREMVSDFFTNSYVSDGRRLVTSPGFMHSLLGQGGEFLRYALWWSLEDDEVQRVVRGTRTATSVDWTQAAVAAHGIALIEGEKAVAEALSCTMRTTPMHAFAAWLLICTWGGGGSMLRDEHLGELLDLVEDALADLLPASCLVQLRNLVDAQPAAESVKVSAAEEVARCALTWEQRVILRFALRLVPHMEGPQLNTLGTLSETLEQLETAARRLEEAFPEELAGVEEALAPWLDTLPAEVLEVSAYAACLRFPAIARLRLHRRILARVPAHASATTELLEAFLRLATEGLSAGDVQKDVDGALADKIRSSGMHEVDAVLSERILLVDFTPWPQVCEALARMLCDGHAAPILLLSLHRAGKSADLDTVENVLVSQLKASRDSSKLPPVVASILHAEGEARSEFSPLAGPALAALAKFAQSQGTYTALAQSHARSNRQRAWSLLDDEVRDPALMELADVLLKDEGFRLRASERVARSDLLRDLMQLVELGKSLHEEPRDAPLPYVQWLLREADAGSLAQKIQEAFNLANKETRELHLQAWNVLERLPRALQLHFPPAALDGLPVKVLGAMRAAESPHSVIFPRGCSLAAFVEDRELRDALQILALLESRCSLLQQWLMNCAPTASMVESLHSGFRSAERFVQRCQNGTVCWRDIDVAQLAEVAADRKLHQGEAKALASVSAKGLAKSHEELMVAVLEALKFLDTSPARRFAHVKRLIAFLEKNLETLPPELSAVVADCDQDDPSNLGCTTIRTMISTLGSALDLEPTQVLDLHWEQVEWLRALPRLLDMLRQHTPADLNAKINSLRSKCLFKPELISPVKQLEGLVQHPLIAELLKGERSWKSMRPAVVAMLRNPWLERDLRQESIETYAKLLQAAGADDLSSRARLMVEELTSMATKLQIEVTEYLGQPSVNVTLSVAEKSVVAIFGDVEGTGQLRGVALTRLSAELCASGTTLRELGEAQGSDRLLAHTHAFSRRIEECSKRQILMQGALDKGWRPQKSQWIFPAVPVQADGDTTTSGVCQDFDQAGLSIEELQRILADQDRRMRELWLCFPFLSLADPFLVGEKNADVLAFLSMIPRRRNRDQEAAERPMATPLAKVAHMIERQRQLRFPTPAEVPEVPCDAQNLSLVALRDRADSGLVVGRLLVTMAPDAGPDCLLSCTPHCRPYALEGFFWRLFNPDISEIPPVTVIAMPERLPLPLQQRLCENLGRWQLRPITRDGWRPRVVVVAADRECHAFHRMLAICGRDAGLERQAYQHVTEPWPRTVACSVVKGAPLSGKTEMIRAMHGTSSALKAITVNPESEEMDLAKHLREHWRLDPAPDACIIDIGCSPSAVDLTTAIFSLLRWGVCGTLLPLPFAVQARRHASRRPMEEQRRVVLEVGGITKFPLLDLLVPSGSGSGVGVCEATGVAEPDPAPMRAVRQIADRLAEEGGSRVDSAIVEAIKTDLQGEFGLTLGNSLTGTGSVGGVRTEAVTIKYAHTALSVNLMADILGRIALLRKQTQRATPLVVLLGETGCGKTYLLQKLLELLARARPDLVVCPYIVSLSNAFGTSELQNYVADVVTRERSRLHLIIFDEVNTTAAQPFLAQLFVNRRFGQGASGQTLPDNVLFFGTCNPHAAGYDVYPLAPSLEASAIQVPSPSSTDVRAYLVALCGESFADLIVRAQQLNLVGPCSLRDAMRCSSLATALDDAGGLVGVIRRLLKAGKLDQGATSKAAVGRPTSDVAALELANSTVVIPGSSALVPTLGALSPWAHQHLALYIAYGLRTTPRSDFFHALGDDVRQDVEFIRGIVWEGLQVPEYVVLTDTISDNVLAVTCALTTCTHTLLLGDEGSSKTLSLSLVLGAARGSVARSTLFRALPRLQPFQLQMNPSTTATHVCTLTDSMRKWMRQQQDSGEDRAIVVVEELGMAAESPTKPLKALHYLLDLHTLHPEDPPFVVVATTNHTASGALPLDGALMNRFATVANGAPSPAQLTTLCIAVAGGEESDGARLMIRAMPCFPKRERFVRDILGFARSAQYTSDVPLLFWSHMQSPHPSETADAWPAIATQLLGSSVPQAPSLRKCLHHLLSVPVKAVRHMLLTFRHPKGLAFLFDEIASALEELGSPRELYVLRGGVHPEDTTMSVVLMMLSDLKQALARGATVVVLNPGSVLPCLHAVLNADYASTSETMSTYITGDVMQEEIPVHPQSRLILIMESNEASRLHPSVLSRMSILHPPENVAGASAGFEYRSPEKRVQAATTWEDLRAVCVDVGRSLAELLDDVSTSQGPTIAVALTRAHAPPQLREGTQMIAVASLGGLHDFERKVSIVDKNEPLLIDFYGVGLTEFLDYCVSLGFCGHTKLRETSPTGPVEVKLSCRMPRRLLLVCPPAYASRLMFAPKRHILSVYWVDQATRPDGRLLHELLDPETLFAEVVKPKADAIAAEVGKQHRLSSKIILEAVRIGLADVLTRESMLEAVRMLTTSSDDIAQVGSLRDIFLRFVKVCTEKAAFRILPFVKILAASEAEDVVWETVLTMVQHSDALPPFRDIKAPRTSSTLWEHPADDLEISREACECSRPARHVFVFLPEILDLLAARDESTTLHSNDVSSVFRRWFPQAQITQLLPQWVHGALLWATGAASEDALPRGLARIAKQSAPFHALLAIVRHRDLFAVWPHIGGEPELEGPNTTLVEFTQNAISSALNYRSMDQQAVTLRATMSALDTLAFLRHAIPDPDGRFKGVLSLWHGLARSDMDLEPQDAWALGCELLAGDSSRWRHLAMEQGPAVIALVGVLQSHGHALIPEDAIVNLFCSMDNHTAAGLLVHLAESESDPALRGLECLRWVRRWAQAETLCEDLPYLFAAPADLFASRIAHVAYDAIAALEGAECAAVSCVSEDDDEEAAHGDEATVMVQLAACANALRKVQWVGDVEVPEEVRKVLELDPDEHCGVAPLRKYAIRCAVAALGEDGVATCPSGARALGDWSAEYFKPFPPRGSSSQRLEEGVGAASDVLLEAIRSIDVGARPRSMQSNTVPRWAGALGGFSEGFNGVTSMEIYSDLEMPYCDFFAVPAAILLWSLKYSKNSAFNEVREEALIDLWLPAGPMDEAALAPVDEAFPGASTSQSLSTAQNEAVEAPDEDSDDELGEGRRRGGPEHQGRPSGIAPHIERAATATVREMTPVLYRLCHILALLPLATAGKDAGAVSARREQLRTHMKVFQDIINSTSLIETGQVIAMVIERCRSGDFLLEGVSFKDTPQELCEERIASAVGHRCPRLLTAEGRGELIAEAQSRLQAAGAALEHPLMELRHANIPKILQFQPRMRAEDAWSTFAPDETSSLRLCKSLFEPETLRRYQERLTHLGPLAAYLSELHRAANWRVAPGDGTSLRELLRGSTVAEADFIRAWNALANLEIYCEGKRLRLTYINDPNTTPAELLLVTPGSPSAMVLKYLADFHNSNLQDLKLPAPDSPVPLYAAPPMRTAEAAARIDAGLIDVDVLLPRYPELSAGESLRRALVDIHARPTITAFRSLERALRTHFAASPLRRFDPEWPVHRFRTGTGQKTKARHLAQVPPPQGIEMSIRSLPTPRKLDLLSCLQLVLQRHDNAVASPDKLISDCLTPDDGYIMPDDVRQLGLQLKHVEALQEMLSSSQGDNMEDSLSEFFRAPLRDEDASQLQEAVNHADIRDVENLWAALRDTIVMMQGREGMSRDSALTDWLIDLSPGAIAILPPNCELSRLAAVVGYLRRYKDRPAHEAAAQNAAAGEEAPASHGHAAHEEVEAPSMERSGLGRYFKPVVDS